VTWLLDTCVLSEYVKRAPNGRGIAWVDARPEARLFISALTLAELLRRVVKRRASDPPRADRLAAWVRQVEARFAGRILSFDQPAARVWAQRYGEAEVHGVRPPLMDSLILATAETHGLTVVSHNISDFAGYGLIHNPWA
jgi:predicted nucleic acid-binding protein